MQQVPGPQIEGNSQPSTSKDGSQTIENSVHGTGSLELFASKSAKEALRIVREAIEYAEKNPSQIKVDYRNIKCEGD